jgi:hypothetical protein
MTSPSNPFNPQNGVVDLTEAPKPSKTIKNPIQFNGSALKENNTLHTSPRTTSRKAKISQNLKTNPITTLQGRKSMYLSSFSR